MDALPLRGRIAPALVLSAVCAAAVALWAAPAAAACASLRHVQSFHGHATMTFAAGASGKDEDAGGIESIGLGRAVQGGAVNLTKRTRGSIHGHGVVVFDGHISGGRVQVADTFENTGTDEAGEATYDGPLPRKDGTAQLILARGACGYKLHIGFVVDSGFAGDEAVNPGRPAGGDVWSEGRQIPDSLSLHGSWKAGAYPVECENASESGESCAVIESGWMSDFVRLFECGSLQVGLCQLEENPEIGIATFAWHLKPKFAKGRRR